VQRLETSIAIAVVPAFALLALFLGLYLGQLRIYEDGEPPQGLRIINAFADFTYKRRVFEVLLDVVLIALAYYGAYVLRWDGRLDAEQLGIFLNTLPIVIIIEMTVFLIGGIYRGLWRYAGINDLVVIAKSVVIGAMASALAVFFMYSFSGPSRAVLLLNGLLILLLMSASRLSFRVLKQMLVLVARPRVEGVPVLIYGAGDGGELIARECRKNPQLRYQAVGFLDDNLFKQGQKILGLPVLGGVDRLDEILERTNAQGLLISSASVLVNGNAEKARTICQERGIWIRRLRLEFVEA